MCQPVLSAVGEAGKAIGSPVVGTYNFVQDSWNKWRDSLRVNRQGTGNPQAGNPNK